MQKSPPVRTFTALFKGRPHQHFIHLSQLDEVWIAYVTVEHDKDAAETKGQTTGASRFFFRGTSEKEALGTAIEYVEANAQQLKWDPPAPNAPA